MKVCLFTDTLGDLNGVSRFIQDMGEQSYQNQETDFELQIATATSKPIPDTPYIHNLPYHFKILMPFYQELDLVLPNRKAIRQFLTAQQPDHVHISTPGPFGWAAKKEAEKLKVPLFGTYHTDFPAYLHDLTRSSWAKKQTDKTMTRFYQHFEHIFSRSNIYVDILQKDLKLPSKRLSTLFPGTNLQRFHPDYRSPSVWKKFNLTDERLKILYVGRINIEKNIPFLLEVWRTLYQTHPDLKADLILVGEGRYRKWADKMRPFHIHFIGPVQGETLSALYASSDCFIFPSTTDTLGQVIMEAQASGLGCLVSDKGGPQSLLQKDSGKIIEANNTQAWVDALLEVVTQEEIRHIWANNSRPNAEQYDIVKSFQQFRDQHLSKVQT
ncbi:glycosyltransferase family 1 protein [Hydrogenovibrio sp. 3SP14C1]|uniref:glycosyltransferase family 4 protein n=1 Tax=Hydrogenovibrio sp. 3SP14C1 TaxID=3038774 RepID=UPI002415F513|nr:glycosyltransferase family 1 protein [Hydrogenovibrio sp. 3SP14C1]MDG4812171.1 glycosyltransferase family 1 protein [Hydrogenovibrio sp. 3SP14C1]